jgi:IS5 family transposase
MGTRMSTPDFFRSRLDAMLDLRHLLAVLATRMPWKDIEMALAPVFIAKNRAGQTVEGIDLFGPTWEIAGSGFSPAGRKRLPIRLMVGLLYLKHAYNESDDTVCARWVRTSIGSSSVARPISSPVCPATLPIWGAFAAPWNWQGWKRCSPRPSWRRWPWMR